MLIENSLVGAINVEFAGANELIIPATVDAVTVYTFYYAGQLTFTCNSQLGASAIVISNLAGISNQLEELEKTYATLSAIPETLWSSIGELKDNVQVEVPALSGIFRLVKPATASAVGVNVCLPQYKNF